MTSRRFAIGLLLAWASLHPALSTSAQTSVEPGSLVGEWVGTWTAGATSGGSGGRGGPQGPYSLVITRVDGDRVFGTVAFREFSGKVVGTLSGNTLTFAGERFRTELTVDGNQMHGTRQGGGVPARAIQLQKKT